MTETASAGATPVAEGATPSQTTPVSPAPATAAPTTPATGEPDGNGLTSDAGRQALQRERDRAEKAERELARVTRANLTENERAIADAKAAGELAATERFTGAVRRSEVQRALLSAGIDPSLIDIAARADQFAALKVSPDGAVEGVEAAVESFKKATPALFTKPSGRPDTGLGPRGTPATGGTDLNTWIRKEAGRA
jgi:hypothetical protein